MNDIPQLFVSGVDCPEVMKVNDTEDVRVVVTTRGLYSESHEPIYLRSKAFDIEPSQPVEIFIPEGKGVEASWSITARQEGLQILTIPANPWDYWPICMIDVVDKLWLDIRETRILNIIGIILGSFLYISFKSQNTITVDKSLRKESLTYALVFTPVAVALLFNSLFILQILSILRAIGLILVTQLLFVIWTVLWYADIWKPAHGIILIKIKNILFVSCFISGLIFGAIYLFVPTGDVDNIFLSHPVFSVLFILPAGMLLLYPLLETSWNQPWEEISKFRRATRIFLYVLAGPLTVVALLLALNENLRLFF
jgi:hypothetical protein